MSERTSRKIPVTERQFLWVQDDDKGEVTLHVGPTMVSPTAADRVVVDDGQGGLREDTSGQPQRMIELGDNQYAVMFNPLLENDGPPNGRFKSGRNEPRALRNGTRSMIPGPCSFYVRPGQRVEVRDAHELASNQYLLVKVYGEVDKTAPYFGVTIRSAGITRATAENIEEPTTKLGDTASADLTRGQLIVIRGLDTQFYIPPSGVDVVPDTSIDDSGAAATSATARVLLAQLGPEVPEALLTSADDFGGYDRDEAPKGGMARRGLAEGFVDQSARTRQRKAPAPIPSPAPPAPQSQGAFGPPGPGAMQNMEINAPNISQERVALAAAPTPPTDLTGAARKALETQARQARLVRNAVVLGEKEYCVIIDADGKREIKVGPARVFPGPYDTFMTVKSRGRIYDAYELLPQRALWLRVIANVSRDQLAIKFPRGVSLDQDQYHPGDELVLTGVSSFFFPFNEIEVLSPETGQAVVGNDHGRVFIEAIGIDQKSGIYVRDLSTGEVRLVRGKQSYLVDPRKEVQITRTVQVVDWNLWIAANEPHKRTHQPMTTPWALSIVVPNNTAVLVTSANSRRMVEGPCVTLLGYEESLCAVTLSTGTPKSDDALLSTVFLRTTGNRVSDEIGVETADFVRIAVRVSYSITFVEDQKDRWFNHENYIQVLCDHLRSIVRNRCRNLSLSALWPQLPSVVRDIILGERKEGARPGRIFADNGCIVTEVEVLAASIEDEEVSQLMQRVQTESVTLTIGDRQAQEAIASAKLRAEFEQEHQRLREQQKRAEASLVELTRTLTHQAELAETRERELIAKERQALGDAREQSALAARLERATQEKSAALGFLTRDAETQSGARRLIQAAELERLEAEKNLEVALVLARSQATVAEHQAVQRGLVEALTALGDKIMLGQVAENMNLVSLFKGKDVGTILSDVLGGTRVMTTLGDLATRYSKKPTGE